MRLEWASSTYDPFTNKKNTSNGVRKDSEKEAMFKEGKRRRSFAQDEPPRRANKRLSLT